MSFPRYESYKESGVEWLGDVPEHWDVFHGRRLFTNRREVASDSDEQLAASQKYGVIPQTLMMELNDSKVMLALKGTESFRHVEKNDFVISLRSFEGGIEHSNYIGCVSPAYTVLKALKVVEPNFFRYLFKSKTYVSALQSTTDSLRDGKSITYQQFGDIQLVLPSVFEQQTIAAFLDRETAKIDALIAEQQRLIELLKEKRQSVISHAVTKGLNPNAPMKDSGIEWLGEVPEHWEVRKLNSFSNKITNGYVGPTRDILVEDGVPYAQATHIKGGRILFDGAYFVTLKWSSAHAKSILQLGDVLIVQTGAGTGDIGLVTEDEIGFNCHALIIVSVDKAVMYGEFLAQLLRSTYGRETLSSIQTGAMHPHLNCGEVKFISLPVPPIEEQAAIVSSISSSISQFESLIQEAVRATNLLKERRTALISAAVTGKIDVRGLVSAKTEVKAETVPC
jgi:type I restriction enzyme S subunit